MSLRTVDSYFRSEDEALSASSALRRLGAKGIRIERMLGDHHRGQAMPTVAFASPSFPTGTNAEASAVSNSRFPIYKFIDEDEESAEAKALLSFHIDEEKLNDSLRTVSEFGGRLQ